MRKDGSTCGWLGWSDKPIAIDQLNDIIVDPNALGKFKSKSGEYAKLTYLSETFVGVFLAIKPAIESKLSGEKLGNVSELRDVTCTTKVLLFRLNTLAANFEIYR